MRSSILSVSVFLAGALSAAQPVAQVRAGHARFDDGPYAELLQRHTREGTIGGVPVTAVDYAALAKQAGDPKSLYRRVLDDFARFDPVALRTSAAHEAFWMNAYN